MKIRGSSRKWSDSTWTHRKQLEQLLQQVTTLRGDIVFELMLTKGCCKGNNYEQRFALDTFPADFCWRNVLAKPCILLFTLQQECNTREACRLLLVVKVVFVVFPNSAGIVSPQALCIVVYLAAGGIGNSTNPITRFSGRTKKMMGDGTHSIPHQGVMTVLISSSFLRSAEE